MKTATVQIGNSDDKLTQKQWADFVAQIDEMIRRVGEIHFFGGAGNFSPWQNAAWVFNIEDEHIDYLESCLVDIRCKFKQDSVAVTYGETRFI